MTQAAESGWYSFEQMPMGSNLQMIFYRDKKGDVLVGISTSGNSRNILEAYKVCQEMGIEIISMTGSTGGKMKDYGGLLLNVPSNDTPRIQECHIMIGHIICELVESAMFKRQ